MWVLSRGRHGEVWGGVKRAGGPAPTGGWVIYRAGAGTCPYIKGRVRFGGFDNCMNYSNIHTWLQQ